MDYYIDIKLLPDAELSETFLMNMVFTKLHKALDDLNSDSIGVSFPNYGVFLGSILRIHGSESNLESLTVLKWQGRLTDYCTNTPISPVPESIDGYRTVSRIQSSMSPSKLRRLLSRKTINTNDIGRYEKRMQSKAMTHPYLELKSTSNGHVHRRYIVQGDLLNFSRSGAFDRFGLSKVATVPCFPA